MFATDKKKKTSPWIIFCISIKTHLDHLIKKHSPQFILLIKIHSRDLERKSFITIALIYYRHTALCLTNTHTFTCARVIAVLKPLGLILLPPLYHPPLLRHRVVRT